MSGCNKEQHHQSWSFRNLTTRGQRKETIWRDRLIYDRVWSSNQREQRRGLPGRGTEPRPFAGEGPQDYEDEMPRQGASVFPTGLSGRSQMPGKGEFRVKFNGDPKQLSYFITNVRHFMEDFGDQFPSESAKIHTVGANLKEAAADWLMQMYDTGVRELACLEDFLRAFRERFEDPLAEERAKAQLKRIYQGGRTVSEYVLEFKATAGKIRDWSDTTKLEYFRAGLRSEVLEWASHRGNPRDLEDWILLAGRGRLSRELILSSQVNVTSSSKGEEEPMQLGVYKRLTEVEKERRKKFNLCLYCGGGDHFARNCSVKPSKVPGKGQVLA
uniref:Retrotransposon gag domain-containing protein n=1 Tax=Anolis carolinensis TaxID=28377 RepID=A0A803TH52_ANOCA